MVMQTTAFFAQLRKLKAYIDEHPDASSQLREAYERVNAAFKKRFTPEEFKTALAEGAAVDSELEESITSAMVLMNQDRARRGA